MKQKWRKKTATFLMLMSLLCSTMSGTVYAKSFYTHVTNEVKTGIVSIDLKEYSMNQKGELIPWSDQEDVLPGQIISKIPRITNLGNDCYVRAKVEIVNPKMISMDGIRGDKTNWKKDASDGYWYYTKPLLEKESTDIFKYVRTNPDYEDQYTQNDFQIVVTAEAVQADNFVPDFTSDTPWGDTKIEKQKKTAKDITRNIDSNHKFCVVYENGANALFTNSDNFFSNFPVMMPGDAFEDKATLTNHSKKTKKVYFKSLKEMKDSPVLDAVDLKITVTMDGKETIFYDGKLSGKGLEKYQCIGKLKPGKSGTFAYQLSVPSEMENPFALANEDVTWYFSMNQKNPKPVKQNKNKNDSPNTTLTDQTPSTPSAISKVVPTPVKQVISKVQTGDTGMGAIFLGLAVIFGILGICMKPKNRKQ